MSIWISGEIRSLTYEEIQKWKEHIKTHGIIQFINWYNKVKDIEHDTLKWGDEVSRSLNLFLATEISISSTWWNWKIFWLQFFSSKSCLMSLRKIPNIHLICWWGNFVETHNFLMESGKWSKTLQKPCISTKIPHQEVRWNYGIFWCVYISMS